MQWCWLLPMRKQYKVRLFRWKLHYDSDLRTLHSSHYVCTWYSWRLAPQKTSAAGSGVWSPGALAAVWPAAHWQLSMARHVARKRSVSFSHCNMLVATRSHWCIDDILACLLIWLFSWLCVQVCVLGRCVKESGLIELSDMAANRSPARPNTGKGGVVVITALPHSGPLIENVHQTPNFRVNAYVTVA